MPDLNLDDHELAAGAAIASEMAREDRRLNKHVKATTPSTWATVATIAFVAIALIVPLAIMLWLK